MNFFRGLKQSVGKRVLAREIEPVRLREGSNFNSARRIAIIYKDDDEAFFKKLKQYSAYLRTNYGVKSVLLMGFVDLPEKYIPVWQQHVLESDFFTRKDLNWYMRPVNKVLDFIKEDFDILIDFSSGDEVPLNFIMKESRAHMKVGIRGTRAERYCDFIIDMGEQYGMAQYVEQLNSYLSNPKIK